MGQVRLFLREKVAAGQAAANQVARQPGPYRERVEQATDDALFPP